MSASKHKQLSIRSEEAYATAHDLAAHLGMTTTDVVVSALREYRSRHRIPSKLVAPEQAEANFRAIMRGVEAARKRHPPGTRWNVNDLYDEYGAPK